MPVHRSHDERIDPAIRYVKTAQSLRPGGVLAPFRSEHVKSEQDGDFFAAAQEVYWRAAPALAAAYTGLRRPEVVVDNESGRIAASIAKGTPLVYATKNGQFVTFKTYKSGKEGVALVENVRWP